MLIKTVCAKVCYLPKMPKSISTVQNQITGCERNTQEALAQCAVAARDKDFSFNFSFKAIVEGIASVDIEARSASLTKVVSFFQECEKITTLEKKRRGYMVELKKILETREK